MTEISEVAPSHSSSNNKKIITGQHQLKTILQKGASEFRTQIRFVLALSQVNHSIEKSPKPANAPMPTLNTARLQLISSLPSNTLSDMQHIALLKAIHTIPNLQERLLAMSHIVGRLKPEEEASLLQTIWQHIDQLQAPHLQAEILHRVAHLFDTQLSTAPSDASSAIQVILQNAQTMKNTEARVRSLTALKEHLSTHIFAQIMSKVLDDLDALTNDAVCAKSLVAVAAFLPSHLHAKALQTALNIQSPIERERALTSLALYITADDLHYELVQHAFSTIDLIDSEEERAEALIALVATMEENPLNHNSQEALPQWVEQALAVTITILRRHIRARVLVALSPYLTIDLQGEALAAVHSLSNESDRALFLAQLAPTLPSDMLVASLAVAHTMREQDSRAHALGILAHYIDENARAQTILDALAAASNLTHQFERVRALVNLLDILPQNLYDQALTNALETTRFIRNDNSRARAIALIAEYLSPALLERALEIADELGSPNQRLNAYVGLYPHLEHDEQMALARQMLDCVKSIRLEYKQARALITTLPHFENKDLRQLRPEIEAIADGFHEAIDRINVYVGLMTHLNTNEYLPLMSKSWQLISHIEMGYDKATVLVALAPFLPARAQADFTRTTVEAIISIHDEYDQASAVSLLAPLLQHTQVDMPLPDSLTALRFALRHAINISDWVVLQHTVNKITDALLESLKAKSEESIADYMFEVWTELAPIIATRPMPYALSILACLMPIFATFVSQETFTDVAQLLGVR